MRRGDSTVVVGASAAGLAVARCLQEKGLSALVLEQKPQVAEAWRRHYDRLHLHTSRDGSALPYRAMPSTLPTYPSRLQVIDYLEHYAAGLKEPPLFNQTVKTVRHERGVWVTATEDRIFASNNVVIATGNTRKPVVPTWPGMERYTGRVTHTADYRNGYALANHRVLVVGFGNSAAEIAVDLAENGAQPTLSVRGAVNVIPRDVLGIPVQSLGLVQRLFPPRVADLINAPVVRLAVGDITKHGLRKLPFGPATQVRELGQIPVIDAGAMKLIRRGTSPGPPEAIFCWSDFIALEVLSVAKELGLSVPGDLAVVGYDNTSYCDLAQNGLTSIDQSGQVLGLQAARLLVERIKGRKTAEHFLVTPRLVARASSGARTAVTRA